MSMFPPKFVWGAATASYQIEGSPKGHGFGPCIWEMMSRIPGKIFEGHHGQVACDHFHRYEEDIEIMKSIGLKAYRFSLAWPKILPDGTGAVNEAGLDFYDRLVDALIKSGIEPWITLYHWDLPYALHLRGGWLNPAMPSWFEEYTRVVVDRLSDRVSHWFTINEPQCILQFGYCDGTHAPGLKMGDAEVLRAAHNLVISHGKAIRVIRERAKTTPKVGWTIVAATDIPATQTEACIEAAREKNFAVVSRGGNKFFSNSLYGDCAVFGRYPDDVLKEMGHLLPPGAEDEMMQACQKMDFFGINLYTGDRVDESGDRLEQAPGNARSHFHWPITPEALYWATRFFYERYALPLIVAENGMASHDWVNLEGEVKDPQRIDMLRRYLRALERSISDGVDVRGYFQWSLLDNFEWAEGYRYRFGLVHVDYQTQKRTPKQSASWYGSVIESNGASL